MPNRTPSIARLILGALLLATTGCASRTAQTPPPQGDLRFSAHAVIEAAPVHHALHHLRAGDPDIPNGGIAALYRNMPRGDADLAGHADTQALRHSLGHPDLRIILTVTEGHYRIVTRRATGIRSVADLRGRKVATVKDSSAAFYLKRALDTAGLREADVQIVPIPLPPKDAGKLLIDGGADALVLWDPEPEIAIHHLGKDAVILDPDTGYQELYNLHTTAAKLADPVMRAKIVRFVATLMQASREIRRPSAQTIALTAQITGYAPDLIRASWPQHRFPARLSPALLDTLTTEEAWMAANDRRAPRTRETLATLIDPSVQAEAEALLRGK
jgi:sulfonate transport system substrate-binding protein